MNFKPEQIRPVEIHEIGNQLRIFWRDSHESVYPFPYLRRKCQCAACIDEWTGELRLLPEKISEEVHPLNTHPVGNYGIRFQWSDGHSTGIYAFDYLRLLCPCSVCVSAK